MDWVMYYITLRRDGWQRDSGEISPTKEPKILLFSLDLPEHMENVPRPVSLKVQHYKDANPTVKGVLVSQGCYNKLSTFKRDSVSQFWRMEVMPPLKLIGENPFLISSSLWDLLAIFLYVPWLVAASLQPLPPSSHDGLLSVSPCSVSPCFPTVSSLSFFSSLMRTSEILD